MSLCTCEQSLPPGVLRYVRAFKPRFRDILLRFLNEKRKIVGTMEDKDIFECIAMAYEVLESDISTRVVFPSPDVKTVELARAQAKTGEGRTIREILNGLS